MEFGARFLWESPQGEFGKSPQDVQISNRGYSRKSRTITDVKEVIREEMRPIPRPVCKSVIDNFVPRVKKFMELKMVVISSTRSRGHKNRLIAIVFWEYNKLVMSEFYFNWNGNLRNDKHRKLGPFLGHPV